MSYDSWVCVMSSGTLGTIPDYVRISLKMVACDLYRNKNDSMHFSNEFCEGIITTDWETQVLVNRVGVFFKTQFEHDGGECRVNFLLNEENLKAGADKLRDMFEEDELSWEGISEELPDHLQRIMFQFDDLRSGGSLRLQ